MHGESEHDIKSPGREEQVDFLKTGAKPKIYGLINKGKAHGAQFIDESPNLMKQTVNSDEATEAKYTAKPLGNGKKHPSSTGTKSIEYTYKR